MRLGVGLMIGGALGMLFSVGIRKAAVFSGENSELGLATLFLSTLFLCFVGLFPVETGMIHTLASFLFFVLSIISLILLGKVLRKSEDRKYGYFVLFLCICSAISFPFFFVPRPWGMNAVVEMVSSVSMSIFILTYSIRVLKNSKH